MAPHSSSRRFALWLLAMIAVAVWGEWNSSSAKPASRILSGDVIDSGLNVVHIRFDTLKLQPGQHDVLMPVRWSYSLPKPHDFHAFNVHFAVDPTKVTIVEFLQQGTATDQSWMGADAFTNTNPLDARFVMLGDHEPDWSNPILFYVRVSVQLNPGDVVPFHWTYVEDPKYFKVDTITTEDGWLMLEPPKPASIAYRDTTMRSDSIISVPVTVSDLNGAGLTAARFEATLDTSIFDFISVTPGPTEQATVNAELTGSRITADLSATGTSTLVGNTTLLFVQLHAKHRQDTACSALTDGSLKPLNSGAYLGTVSAFFGNICVYGVKPPDIVARGSVVQLEVFPNPATNVVHLTASEPVSEVQVYDLLGHEVYSARNITDWSPSPSLANGCYHLIARDREGVIREADVTLVR